MPRRKRAGDSGVQPARGPSKSHKPGRRLKNLKAFHDKLGNLAIFDSAYGCGNIAYRELRELEIEVLKESEGTDQLFDVATIAKINVDQFFGIEISEFPVRMRRSRCG
jgi:restriction-modification enzyme MmeI-like protein